MRFTVKQIQIVSTVRDRVNQLGHAGAAERYPEYKAYLDTTCRGSRAYRPEYNQFYLPVCEIEADDLNGVFAVGNMGPEESITRIAPMRSVSVGDIIEDESGSCYMVDSFGFGEIA
jgi:hypothetical protein